jgi:AmmeMemoRadiSam system protein A
VLDVRNSSDTAGDPERVVGYAAFAFEAAAAATQPQAEDEKGPVLLKLARAGIAAALGQSTALGQTAALGQSAAFDARHAWLRAHGASFVTLTRRGELRGCIGTLEAHRPLAEDVRENAVAAAFHDPRFAPLSRAEFDAIRVEVSLLSPAEPLGAASERDALASLRPHVDGVVFEFGHYRSTFLPQVWEQLPDPVDFLAQLKRKAGLSMNFWDAGVRLSRYTVSKWKEAAA